MKNRNNTEFHQISKILILAFFISLEFISCKKTDRIPEIQQGYFFELVDSVKIDLMNDFGFVTNRAVDGFSLAYTYQEGVFHLINKSGEVEYSIDRRGEGPGEYSPNL